MLRVYVLAKIGDTVQTSIPLTDFSVDVYRTDKSTQASSQLVAGADMTRELADGFYVYTLDTDDSNYDLMAVVGYTGGLALDIQTWLQTDASGVIQKGVSLLSYALFARSGGVPQTALTLADFEVDVYQIAKTDSQPTQIATAEAMTVNMGGGNYQYYKADLDFQTYDYLVLVTYTGAVALDELVWGAKPLGDIPGADISCPTYDRQLPRTLLPLDTWAQIMGLDLRHFRQVVTNEKQNTSCDKVWKQYAWQEADQVGRYDVALAIQQAEEEIAQYLGYKLLPTWEVDERMVAPKPGATELLNVWMRDARGFYLSTNTRYGRFVSGGIEAKTLIESDVAVNYSQLPNGAYIGTIEFMTTVEDVQELAVFYPCESTDEWEIRPFVSASISGGVATMVFRKEQMVLPELIEALDPGPADGDGDTDFLATVDVYRRYNDPSQQVQLIWSPEISNCSCGLNTCPECTHSTQWGCLRCVDWNAGQVVYRPADWDSDDEEFDCADPTVCRAPDRLRLWYRAGLQDKRKPYPLLQMDEKWARAVTWYSLKFLDRPICGCNNVERLVHHWNFDMSVQPIDGASYRLSDAELQNPLGRTRGALNAWKLINQPNQIQGRAVRY